MGPNDTPIQVRSYDASWPAAFEGLAADIRSALGSTARRVDHIGSTAVPQLAAKPTIDIQVAVDNIEDLDRYRLALEHVGYTFHVNSLRDEDHRFFSLPGRVAHVHICTAGGDWERRHLLFRDYLRAHVDVGTDYEHLKYRLAEVHPDDRVAYADAKTEFVDHVMADADRWAAETGWRPPGQQAG